jgi:hypothetical protein
VPSGRSCYSRQVQTAIGLSFALYNPREPSIPTIVVSGAKGAHILCFQDAFIFVPFALVSLQMKNEELPQIIVYVMYL